MRLWTELVVRWAIGALVAVFVVFLAYSFFTAKRKNR
jgi:hypothetical protein